MVDGRRAADGERAGVVLRPSVKLARKKDGTFRTQQTLEKRCVRLHFGESDAGEARRAVPAPEARRGAAVM